MVSLMTWFVLDQNYYSPKAQIKRLWKRVHKLTGLKVKFEGDSVAEYLCNGSYEKEISKEKKKINFLLDYYFDPEEDKEYIKNNKCTLE